MHRSALWSRTRVVGGCLMVVAGVYSIGVARSSTEAGASSSFMRSEERGVLDDEASSVDGGGWTAVRCVSSTFGAWHPAKDMLRGTETYGSPSSVGDDGTWSVAWAYDSYSEMLLGLTDGSQWLIIDKDQLHNYGDPVQTSIKKSSASESPYEAEWYLRSAEDCAASEKPVECGPNGALEDPWATVFDHSADDNGCVYGELSKTGNMGNLGVDGVGACVWVR